MLLSPLYMEQDTYIYAEYNMKGVNYDKYIRIQHKRSKTR
jgi:hypothetical protein